jgi:hypothetical protein
VNQLDPRHRQRDFLADANSQIRSVARQRIRVSERIDLGVLKVNTEPVVDYCYAALRCKTCETLIVMKYLGIAAL